MNTFKNKNTEIFYIVSLHIYAELFNSKDKTTSNMIIRSSVDDGANFVNCAACCKLHGVEGYLHVSC